MRRFDFDEDEAHEDPMGNFCLYREAQSEIARLKQKIDDLEVERNCLIDRFNKFIG